MVEEDMPSATSSLPSDPQALRALAASLQDALAAKERELAARDAEIHAKTLHIEKLRATLALMKRARFGRSSERLEQLELLIGDLEEERRHSFIDPLLPSPGASALNLMTSRTGSRPGCGRRLRIPAPAAVRPGNHLQ
jgi:transposase